MTNFDECLRRTENALRQLKLVKEDPKDELALIIAYGDLQSALLSCRNSFREFGFDPIEARIESGEFDEIDVR